MKMKSVNIIIFFKHIANNFINQEKNKIIGIKDNRILINKLNLIMEDFINAKIINYKHNFSLTFKYHIK